MRYRDIISPLSLTVCEMPDNLVLLHLGQGEMKRLEAMILTMDACLHVPVRRMPTGTAFVEIACRDAETATRLRATWRPQHSDTEHNSARE